MVEPHRSHSLTRILMIQKLKDLKYRLHLMRRERTNAQKRRELTKNGIVFGAGTYCDPSSTIMPKVVMGTNCFVNKETLVGAHTTLGNNVFLGPRVTIFADTHEIGSAAQRAGANITRPVHIKNGTWVGQDAVITAGVTIGEGCVIAAGAVVVHDCAPHGVYAGVPARRIRDLDTEGNSYPVAEQVKGDRS